MERAFDLWAKTERGVPGVEGCGRAHPLPCHLLDVAAVSRELLRDHPIMDRLARVLDCDGAALLDAVVLLAALHDIGKASRPHQALSRTHYPEALCGPYPESQRAGRHAEATAWYLRGSGAPLAPLLGDLLPGADEWTTDPIGAAVAGHHGRPVDLDHGLTRAKIGHGCAEAGVALARTLRDLLAPRPLRVDWEDDRRVVALTWHLATAIPWADWIGSGPHFPPEPDADDLHAYWAVAQARAEAAVTEAGLRPPRALPPDLATLLPPRATPSPAQAWARDVPLPAEGPVLALLEDATGSGKTEAAVHLAHRMVVAGLGRGLHVALPTMATADAMHGRVARLQPAVFGAGRSPALAHGRAWRRRSGGVAADCADWIARENRRAFFAATGAGTVDQAILGVLPVRYAALRLMGLADKVLVLDEVHAFDAYVGEEIEALLRFHAARGGSAVLLSATLPRDTRARLLRAFAEGAGLTPPEPLSDAYPLATVLSGAGLSERALSLPDRRARRVATTRLDDVAAAEDLALARARGGAAVALIRTTVDGAVESHDRLRAAGAEPMLFHARFLPDDRARIEAEVLRRFGPEGGAGDRRGRILVATAVVEQSLDLDFDAMITDLAPADLLIQRAGRLWRHARPGRPATEPVLHVVSPDPGGGDDPGWLAAALPEAEWVHRDSALLWRSARAVFGAGALVERTAAPGAAPDGHPRRLVEAAYDDADTPEALRRSADDAWGERLSHRHLARAAALRPDEPYGLDAARWRPEERVVTRLGDSVAVRLARRDDRVLRPLAGDWPDSEIRLGPRLSRDLRPAPEGTRLDPPPGRLDADVPILVMRRDGARWVEADGPRVYDPLRGLLATGGDDPAV